MTRGGEKMSILTNYKVSHIEGDTSDFVRLDVGIFFGNKMVSSFYEEYPVWPDEGELLAEKIRENLHMLTASWESGEQIPAPISDDGTGHASEFFDVADDIFRNFYY
jgi:hypothetical protein